MKKNPYPTVAEQEKRAKDGWFYEFDLKQWIHVSQVETEEKARQVLKEKNPFRVWLLAWNPEYDVWYPNYTGLARLCSNHFRPLTIATVLACIIAGISGLILGHDHLEYVILFALFLIFCLLASASLVSMTVQERKAVIDEVAKTLCFTADELKNGVIYDVVGNRRFFRN